MSIHTVFEKYHHLDHLLSDRDWLTQDRTASPASEIRAFRLYENGTTEALE